jgi:hypothetical protein
MDEGSAPEIEFDEICNTVKFRMRIRKRRRELITVQREHLQLCEVGQRRRNRSTELIEREGDAPQAPQIVQLGGQ